MSQVPVICECVLCGTVSPWDLYHGQSTLFLVNLPDDKVYDLPPGTHEPCVADRWFVILAPLAAGQHTITTTFNEAPAVYDIPIAPR